MDGEIGPRTKLTPRLQAATSPDVRYDDDELAGVVVKLDKNFMPDTPRERPARLWTRVANWVAGLLKPGQPEVLAWDAWFAARKEIHVVKVKSNMYPNVTTKLSYSSVRRNDPDVLDLRFPSVADIKDLDKQPFVELISIRDPDAPRAKVEGISGKKVSGQESFPSLGFDR
jgi:hypothetical protein